jgi:hypothetical protein
MMKLFYLIFTLFLLTNAQAQTKFYTQLSEEEIYAGQAVQVRYIVEGTRNIRDIVIPSYPEFNVLNMYDVPVSQKMDPVTKKLIPVFTRIVVLESRTSGNFIIKGAIAEIEGKTLRSNNIRIDVRPGNQAASMDEEVQDESEIHEGETIDQKIKENFFLLTEVNKKTVFVGEPLMVTVKACSRLNATSQVLRRPSFTGFSVIEMIDNYDQPPTIEQIGGRNFFVHLIRKVQLLPLQPGKFTIDQAEVQSNIQFVRQDTDMSFEEVLKGKPEMKTIAHTVLLKSPLVTVNVQPLPDTGQPKNFTGAVGKFMVSGRMEKRVIGEGSSALLKLRVEGRGNIPLITAPEVPSTDRYEVSDANATSDINGYEYPLSGVKEFEYVITPKVRGNIEVPSVQFAYYDLSDKKYRQEGTGPIYFRVSEGEEGDSSETIATIEKQGETIDPKYVAFALIALGIIAWVVYQLMGRRKSVEVKQPAVIEEVRKGPIEQVDELIAKGEERKALIAMQELVREKIKVSGEDKYRQILQEIDWALYGGGEVDVKELRDRLV